MKKRLMSIGVIMFLAASTYAQNPKHATARIFEMMNKKLSRIVLVYETGESELIPLRGFKLFGADMDNVLIDNQKTINKLINDMAGKGYVVEQMNTTGEAFLYSFILFKKED